MYTGTDLPFREFLKEGWLRFLHSVAALTEEEKGWLETPAEAFLREVEKTAFTKAYKLPTLRALLTEEGGIRPSVSLREIGEEFIRFYHENPLHQRDLQDKSNRNWRSWGVEESTKKRFIYTIGMPWILYIISYPILIIVLCILIHHM